MTSWTPARSILLSQLLDDVVGTDEMVRIRQDFCRIDACIQSTTNSYNDNVYYTGSKAEGLDLLCSDRDYMIDINNQANLLIIQKMQDAPTAIHKNVFCMDTENVPHCFAMLRNLNEVQYGLLFNACQLTDNAMYLSSYLLVHNAISEMNTNVYDKKIARQGPSIERWSPYMDTSQSGVDNVPSIHCPFWPDSAIEWRTRPRQYAWPSANKIKSIVDFGFHLVPVGHPRSDMNLMEWRISFSVAERTLVWSFNHVQIQCYAVIKIILKEFINPHCSPDNRVLCSYFIKTYLFWKYEETDPYFWCPANLRDCIMFLLCGFRECISRSSLKHYFIIGFHLLSIKLTNEARGEILRIFDVVLQYDISIMKKCSTLTTVLDEFVNTESEIGESVPRRKWCLLKTDVQLMHDIITLQNVIVKTGRSDLLKFIYQFVRRCVQMPCLVSFAVHLILFLLSNKVVGNFQRNLGNKKFYRHCRYIISIIY